MALTPFLAAPTVVSTQTENRFNFVLQVSGSGGPFTITAVQPIVQVSGATGYGSAPSVAVSSPIVGLPSNQNVQNANTCSFPFSVVVHSPLTGAYGANQLSGKQVYAVSCLVFESSTPSVTTTGIVHITGTAAVVTNVA